VPGTDSSTAPRPHPPPPQLPNGGYANTSNPEATSSVGGGSTPRSLFSAVAGELTPGRAEVTPVVLSVSPER
jgi:hypothetical protein